MSEYDGSIRIQTKIDTSQMQRLQLQIEKTTNKVELLSKKLAETGEKKIPTEAYINLEKEINVAYSELNKLYEKQKEMQSIGLDIGTPYEMLVEKLDAAGLKVGDLEFKMEDLVKSGKAFTLGTDTEEYSKVAEDLRLAQGELAALNTKQSEMVEKERKSASEFTKMASNSKSAFSKIKANITNTVSAFGSINSKIQGVFNKLKSHIKGSGGAIDSFGKRIWGLAKRVFVFSLITKGFRSMISGMQEGLQHFAKYSSEYNATMSDFKSSCATLKNSMATAFAPIMLVVVPYITSLINILNDACAAMSKFIAILSGKNSYKKATQQIVDYAEGLENAGDTAKKATADFDQLHTLDISKSETSAGSGAGFEEVEIDGISDFAQQFKDAIEAGDWQGVGALLAQKLNDAMSDIDWEETQDKVNGFFYNIAEGINGFVDAFDWELFGYNVAQGLNTIVGAIDTFLITVDWTSIGKSLADSANSFFATFDWYGLGKTIADSLMAAVKTIGAFAKEFDWAQLGKSLAESLNGFFDNFSFKDAGFAVSNVINGIFKSISTAVDELNWSEIGNNIGEGIGAAIGNIDFILILETVSNALGKVIFEGIPSLIEGLVQGLLEGITKGATLDEIAAGFAIWGEDIKKAFLDSLSKVFAWENTKKIFDEMIKSFQDAFSADNLLDMGINIVNGLILGILSAIEFVVEPILRFVDVIINTFCEALGIHSPSTVFAEFGRYIIEGLLGGLQEVWGNIVGFFDENVGKLASGFKESLSILSKAWDDTWNSIFKSGKNAWDNIWGWIKRQINTFLNGVEYLCMVVVNAMNGMISGLNNLKFTIPDWLPGGGGSFGLSIPKMSHVTVPRLATGAVLRGGNPYMAIVNDQPAGQTNVETPLSTIKQAVQEVYGEGGGGQYTFTANLDGKTIFSETVKQSQMVKRQTGHNPLLV